jgi:hypothetical protein
MKEMQFTLSGQNGEEHKVTYTGDTVPTFVSYKGKTYRLLDLEQQDSTVIAFYWETQVVHLD